MPVLDLSKHTFSQRGSYLSLGSHGRESGRLLLGTSRDHPWIDTEPQGNPRHFYELALLRDGIELPYTVVARPWEVLLQSGPTQARLCFLDHDSLLFEVSGGDLVFLPCHSIVGRVLETPQALDLIDYRGFCVQQFRATDGAQLAVTVAANVDGTSGPYGDTPLRVHFRGAGVFRGAVRLRAAGGPWNEPLPTWEATSAQRRADWAAWQARRPQVPPRWEALADLAWYVLWSNTAAQAGNFGREPMLVCNYWFNRIYAWDNCFHALGVAEADPELAVSQLLLLYDHQSPEGAIPDPLSDQRVHYGLTKPPVHGWCLRELRRLLRAAGTEAALLPHLPALYRGMARWSAWWFTNRDHNADGHPEYIRGMDSGWDNATPFDVGVPVEGADLAAHLSLQCSVLAELAAELGHADEAPLWTQRSTRLRERLVGERWRQGRFVSLGIGGEHAATAQSLLDRLPVVLGLELPPEIREALRRDLGPEGPFLSPHGLATEALASPHFEAQGYWRGPIWAPSTLLIFTGLRDLGAHAEARAVAERFLALCARDGVFWENYNPTTGEGLCCPAMSWTAAVCIRLAHGLLQAG